MRKIQQMISYFTVTERVIWSLSVLLVVISFAVFDRSNYLSLIASLLGVTSLIFNAKGNPFGQFLMLVFGVLYGIISYSFSYYGEMITYLGMTAPMAAFALISWLKHPFKGNRSEVEVNRISGLEVVSMFGLSIVVTAIFYFILQALSTANIIPSTLSVTTSFLAVYLTFRRSPYYAIAYAINDVVLVVLWILATLEDPSYISVVICFIVFLVNDLYGFLNWMRMKKRQESM